jgi:ATP-binding cassette, subfamily B, bacterial
MPEEASKKVTRAWPVIVTYAKAAGKYPWLVASVFVGSLLLEISGVVAPIFLKRLIDSLAAAEPAAIALPALLGLIALYAIAQFVSWFGRRVQMLGLMYTEARVMTDLSNEAFQYLLGHSHDFFVSNFAGSLTRRVNRYAKSFEQLLDSFTFNFFSVTIFAIGAIYVLSQRSLVLGLGLLIWTILFVTLQVYLAKWRQPLRVARAAEDSRVTGVLSDAVANQSTVTQFAASKHEYGIFGGTIERWRVATMRSWVADAWIIAVQGLFALVIEICLLVGAVILWSRGVITVGDFALIQIYVLVLIDRIWNIGNSMRRVFDAFADAYEMVEIMEKPHGVKDVTGAVSLIVKRGEISMKRVSFRFDDERDILSDFSLSIAAGEKVALVGPSGAGKSTITKLLLRLYDLTDGVVEIDGQDISKVAQDSLREAIAFVPQESILFHRSLMDNIRYGRRDATDAEVIEAAKKARCHDFISELPNGYETFVGERGVKLSGGERQRVAIARAILKNAPILILDEATSSLDSESESLIQDALKVLMEGKTVLVIAHRLSTIMNMDRIVVMEHGKIVAEGSHTELLDQQGSLYHKLWSIQAGSFIADTEDLQK